MEDQWHSGIIKTVDKEKKMGIIQGVDGDEVFFNLEDFILPESITDASEIAQEKKTVIFQKGPSKLGFGSEAKKIAVISDSDKM